MHFLAVALVYAAADSSKDSETLFTVLRWKKKYTSYKKTHHLGSVLMQSMHPLVVEDTFVKQGKD